MTPRRWFFVVEMGIVMIAVGRLSAWSMLDDQRGASTVALRLLTLVSLCVCIGLAILATRLARRAFHDDSHRMTWPALVRGTIVVSLVGFALVVVAMVFDGGGMVLIPANVG